MISDLINAIRFVLGFILIIISLRALLRARNIGMFYLTLGFALLTIGNAFSAIYYIDDVHMDKIFSHASDIFGMIALIMAVRKV